MKSVELFCASPASTAICSSMDQRSMVRQGLMRHMERRRPHPHRLGGTGTGTTTTGRRTLPVVPCSSEIPITPRTLFEKTRKSTSATFTKEIISSSGGHELQPPPRRKSSADVTDHHHHHHHRRHHLLLMSNNPMFDKEHVHPSSAPLVPTKLPIVKTHHHHHHHQNIINDFRPVFKSSSSTTSSNDFKQQVVELRVSIHCKGCEGKIRKHISKMEGVASFSTDLATKKVTVTGNVTPLGVLTSISKVKYAEFWETPTSSSSSSSPSSASSSSLSRSRSRS